MTTQAPPNFVIFPLVGNLLSHARGLVVHQSEIERTTASQFNLFQIIGAGHYEVSTHSALLATLLDPRGSHGQGPLFLKRFIATEAIRKAPGFPAQFDADSADVECEISIGLKTEISGGRLDILIKDKNRRKIIIENKIHASEQENWVQRYLKYLGDDGCLLYLTLSGVDPSEAKTEEHKSKVHPISYATTIKDWLVECRKESATIPIVRESLTQYIHLINNLTNQNNDDRMNEQIVKSVLNDAETFKAYCALRDADIPIKGQIVCDFVGRIKSKVPAGFALVSTPKGSCEKYDGFAFSTPTLIANNLYAVVSFDSPEYMNCYFGFELIESSRPFGSGTCASELLASCFKSVFGFDPFSSGRWPAWRHWHPQNWNDEVLRNIKFDHFAFDEGFGELMNNLFDVARSFAMAMAELPAQ